MFSIYAHGKRGFFFLGGGGGGGVGGRHLAHMINNYYIPAQQHVNWRVFLMQARSHNSAVKII